MKSLNPTEIKRLNREWRRATTSRLRIVLVDLANPYNVGSIFRTAAVLGVEHVYLTGATPTPDHPGVKKVALGTANAVPWAVVATAADATGDARAGGFAVVAIELAQGAEALAATDLAGDTCLVFGNEAHGLTAATLAVCDRAAYVPQVGRVASLNVATAAAIAIYEARRQSWG